MSVETKSQLAVALHYDKSGAPRVVAKGRGTHRREDHRGRQSP